MSTLWKRNRLRIYYKLKLLPLFYNKLFYVYAFIVLKSNNTFIGSTSLPFIDNRCNDIIHVINTLPFNVQIIAEIAILTFLQTFI